LWWAAAILVGWVAVRRRRYSIWWTAWHLSLALAVADLLQMGLGFADASILVRSPFRFLGSAVVVAFARLLWGNDPLTW
jgi:hypothetical protein